MWPDRVSNPGPLTYESGVIPTALRGPASNCKVDQMKKVAFSQLFHHYMVRVYWMHSFNIGYTSINTYSVKATLV